MVKTRLKVVLINHSDTQGGASVVTYRLMNALCAEGVDARMLVLDKNTDSLRVDEAANGRWARMPFFLEHGEIFLRNGFNRSTLFKISTGKYGVRLSGHPWVKDADVVIVNWINQGMMSLKEIRAIAREKPVIWTMHDLWNMTGVCHVNSRLSSDGSFGTACENYLYECKDCPLTGGGSLAQAVYRAKRRLYESSNIHFVAVSNEVARLCRLSPLMSKCDISVIPNALPVDKFGTAPVQSRRQIGVPEGKHLVVMGAARLDDPVKNLPLALKALNQIATPDVAAVFYGDLRQPDVLKSLNLPHVWLGRIEGHDKLQSLMAQARVVLSTSVWETLPGTIVEGIATGGVAVATDNGGQSDIIDNGVTGYLVDSQTNTGEDLVSAVADAVDRAFMLPCTPEARQQRHDVMAHRFGAPAVARSYIALFKRILS